MVRYVNISVLCSVFIDFTSISLLTIVDNNMG